MHRRLPLVLALALLLFPVAAPAGPKWPGVPFVKARAYLYNLEGELYGFHAPVKNGALDPTVVGAGTEVPPDALKKILALAASDTRLVEAGLAACYIPHHAIVFFDEKDRPVAWISICFYCEGLRLSPEKKAKFPQREARPKEIRAAEKQLAALRAIVEGLGHPVLRGPEEYKALGDARPR